ncbi:MAG: hypothetical protein VW683_00515 [Betaproteobacteria bacterium]|jgi:hypothetical protein
MPKFVSARDFEFFQHINREIVGEIIDIPVILYKLYMQASKTNIYGEATERVSYTGIKLEALIEYPENKAETDIGIGVNQTQEVDFRFVRRVLKEVKVYPEIGDIISYNERFYEIDNVRETQLIAGRPEYNQSVLCSAHLTRKSAIDLEARQV